MENARRIPIGVVVLAAVAPSASAQILQAANPPADEVEDLSILSRLATTTPRPIERLPSTVTIVPGDEIRRSGVRFLPDALRMFPGVEVNRTSSTEVSVNMRGYNAAPIASQGIMALVDGRQADHAWLGFPLWDALAVDIDELDRVEVLLGPGSFVYGPNAMHGVVNIVTKSPLSYDADYVSVGAATGSYDSTKTRLTSVHRAETYALKSTFVWDDIDEFEPSEQNSKDKVFGEMRFEALLDDDDPLHRVDVTVNRSRQDHAVLLPTLSVIPTATYTDEADESTLRAEYQNHGFRTQLSWDHYSAPGIPDGVYGEFFLDLTTADVDVQYGTELDDGHRLTVGTGLRSSTFDTRDLDISGGEHRATTHWLFVQDEVEFDDAWFLTAGLRYDHHSEVGGNVAPRVALVWEFDQASVDGERTRTQSLRVSYGQGFRYPSLSDLWLQLPVTLGPLTFPILGNLDLEQEKLSSFELAYNGSFPGYRLGATGFYNEIDDLIGFVATVPATRANEEDERVYGFELSGDRDVNDWLSGFGNYSYTHRDDRNGSIDLPPRHKLNIGARAHFLQVASSDRELGLHATVWLHFFDGTRLVNRDVPEYWLLNGYVGYDFEMGSGRDRSLWSVYAQAFNLLDDDHREHPEGDPYGALVMVGLNVDF